MGDVPTHTAGELSHGAGELSFIARVGGRETPVWLRSEGEIAGDANAVVPACLMPAMATGGTLEIDGEVSPRLLRGQREFQDVQRAWSLEWEFAESQLDEVEVLAEAQPAAPPARPGRVAAFFSGGVDSWSTVLGHTEITDLIFVRGFDLMPGAENHARLAPVVEQQVRRIAGELGLELHVVETNLREMSDAHVPWDAYYNSAAAAVALFLAPRFERVLLASGMDHEVDDPIGSARLVDHLWSSEHLDLVDDGGRYSRAERTARIAGHPLVRETLRVCWKNPGGAYNCCACRKCLMTMITVEALAGLDGFTAFPRDLDLAEIERIEIGQRVLLTLWEDVLDTVRSAHRDDLEPAVARAVDAGRRKLGLPSGYRRRHLPGPPPLHGDVGVDREPRVGVDDLLESRSWRLTRPLRRAAAAGRELRSRWPRR